jgi:hypothetical protein
VRARFTPVAAVESLVVAASTGFYTAFILRSDFSFAGKTYYSLIDDSMISMVYARNLVDGHGLVWQAGDKVEGYTNLLWTLWMALLQLLPLPEAVSGLPVMVSGAVILIGTMLVVRSICRVLVPDRLYVAPVAMALVGLCYALDFWTLRGMETGLAALLVVLAVRLALDFHNGVTTRRLVSIALTLAAGVLTRDDLVIPAVVIVAFAAWQSPPEGRRRVVAVLGGALVATVAAHVAFRVAYYGDALPNTYYLKVDGIPLSTRLHRGGVALVFTLLTSLYLAIGAALVALAAAWRTARWAPQAFLAVVVAAELGYSVYVGGDYAEQLQFPNRFMATVVPLLMVLAAIGISDLVRRAGDARLRYAALAVTAVLTLGAVLVQGHGWSAMRRLDIQSGVLSSSTRVAIAATAIVVLAAFALSGRWTRPWLAPALGAALLVLTFGAIDFGPVRHWLDSGADERSLERLEVARAVLVRQHSAPTTSVAVVVAGNWAYFGHRRAIDLLGKADSVIARGPQHSEVPFKPGHTKWDYAYSVGKLRPDIVVDLVFPTARDLCNMRSWGYRQVGPRFFVRDGARGVDAAPLAAELPRIDPRSPFQTPAGCA